MWESIRHTFRPDDIPHDQVFSAVDLNLYFDKHNTLWYKRPDWFGVIGVSKLYRERDLRLSYVIWQEKVRPFIVVEILSPGTSDEDLGKRPYPGKGPPTKFHVYEKILKVPYYVVYDRRANEILVHRLDDDGNYKLIPPVDGRFYFEEIGLYLARWKGPFKGARRLWLRWFDKNGKLIPTAEEEKQRDRTEKERERTEKERERTEKEWERTEKEWERTEKERERTEKEEALLKMAHVLAEKEQERAAKEQERAAKEQERAAKEAAFSKIERIMAEKELVLANATQAKKRALVEVERERTEKEKIRLEKQRIQAEKQRLLALLQQAGIELPRDSESEE